MSRECDITEPALSQYQCNLLKLNVDRLLKIASTAVSLCPGIQGVHVASQPPELCNCEARACQ